MKIDLNWRRIIILICTIAVVGYGILYAKVVFAPRPVLSADTGQVLSIEYYDETLDDVVQIEGYSEENIRKILRGFSEKRTMLKDHGFRLGSNYVVLYAEFKRICFEKDTGYTAQGSDAHWYRIKDADRALKALAEEMHISSLKSMAP